MKNSEIFQSAEELRKAIDSLKIALDLLKVNIDKNSENIELHKALRDACIQRYEFCVELSWKTSMRVLGLDARSPNAAIREMARNNLIEDTELWFDFLVARNKTSHTYDEDIAREVYNVTVSAVNHFGSLHKKISEFNK